MGLYKHTTVNGKCRKYRVIYSLNSHTHIQIFPKKAYLKFEHSLKYLWDISHIRNIYKVAMQSEFTQVF